jgi:hypothetical protein
MSTDLKELGQVVEIPGFKRIGAKHIQGCSVIGSGLLAQRLLTAANA